MRLFAIALLLLAATPASAQFDQLGGPQIGARENAITPRLAVSGDELAIVMDVKPGWHGYWLNPGDAGLPMSVEWQLPPGWTVGPLYYPVPHRLLVSGIVNYVYESDYAVLARLKIPVGATGVHKIAAEMRWLACTDTVCVPEKGRVELDVPANAPSDPRFDVWRKALPQSRSGTARFERDGERLRLAIPLPAATQTQDPYFFPATDGALAYDAPQKIRRDGDQLIVEAKAGTDQPDAIDGVLAFGNGQGVEIRAVRGSISGGTYTIWLIAGVITALLAAFAFFVRRRRV